MDIRDAFFDEIYALASKDENVFFIAADVDAFSLRRYKKDFPNQFLDVGAAEQNMVSVAGGLALSGRRVFAYAIIPFITLRCYEQVKADICSMNLPVTLIGVGPGLSFNYDGPTHHGMQDVAVIRALPGMTILNPCDASSAVACARLANDSKSPVYVRIDKGEFPELYRQNDDFLEGLKVIREIADVNIISTGYASHTAYKVAEELKKRSVDVGVVDVFRLKPLNVKALLEVISSSRKIVTLEENSIIGGLGTMVSELLAENGVSVNFSRIALADTQYFDNGSRGWLHSLYGIDVDSIVKKLLAR